MGMWKSLTRLLTSRKVSAPPQTNQLGAGSLRSMIEAALSGGGVVPSVQRYRQVYKTNELVNAAVNENIRPLLTIPFVAEELDSKTGHWVRRELHPLTQFLADPNPTHDRIQLFERFLLDTFTLGNGVFLKRRKGGQLREMWPLDAARVVPVAEKTGELVYYYFTNGMTFGTGAQMAHLQPSMLKLAEKQYSQQDIIHLMLAPDPDYPIWGLAPGAAALHAINIDEAITAFLTQYFRQGTIMSALFTSKTPLTTEDVDRIIKEWNEHIAGIDRAFGLAVIDGTEGTLTKLGTDVTKELGIHELRMDTEARILAPFNVPPVVVGAVIGITSTQSYASYEQARAALYEENTDVGVKRMETLFTKTIASEFGPNLRVRADTTNVMGLESFRKQRSDRLNSELAAGRGTVNETRSEGGRPDVEGGDVLLQPLNVVQVPVALKAGFDTALPISKTRIRLLAKLLASEFKLPDLHSIYDQQIAATLNYLDAQDGGESSFDVIQKRVRTELADLPIVVNGRKHQNAVRLLLATHILTARARKELA